MAITITGDQVKAYSRHVFTAAASVIGTLAALKIVSGGDASTLQASLDQFSHGFAEMVAAVSTIAVTVSGAYAALSASPLWQLLRGAKAVSASPALAAQVPLETQKEVVKATDKLPTVATVVASPEVANAIPSASVQSIDDVNVVSK